MEEVNRRVEALAIAGLSACLGCGRSAEAGAGQQVPIYTGTREAPIAGLWLRSSRTVLRHDFAGAQDGGAGTIRLDDDQLAVLSPDWRHVVVARFVQDKTEFSFDQGPVHEREGELELLVDPDGSVLLALRADADVPQQSQAELIAGDGGTLGRFVVDGFVWASLAAGGTRVAVGTRGGVRLFGSDGHELASFAAAEVGALSADARWLILEREGAEQSQLELHSLGPAARGLPWTQPVAGSASVLGFSDDLLVRVSRERLQTFDTSSDPPALVLDLPAPGDFQWRDAVRSPDGGIAASRIRIDRPAALEPDGKVFRPGAARVGVDLMTISPAARRSLEWDVDLWNHESPRIQFDAEGKLCAIVWPSCSEVRVP